MNQFIRSVSGANLNLFRYAAMVVVLLMLGIGNAWAGHDTHTATLNVNKGTGSGTVYASTSATATSGSASASFNCGGNEGGQHTGTLYAYATPASGYTFLGWTSSASSSDGADNANPKGVAFDVSSANSSKTLYAHFVEKAKVNITFEAPSNGTYTIAVNGGSAEMVSSADVVKSNVEGVVLTANPASGYAFAGWYKLNSAGEFVEDLSIDSPYDASFTTSETIKMGARFVPTTLGKFILKGSDTQYYGLKAATVAAGGSGTIVPVADETLVDGSDLLPFDNGTYSIKAGATLLIPYSSANEVQTKPKDIAYNTSGLTTALSIYKKLITREGVSINVMSGGVLCVGGQLVSYNGGNPSAYPIGACGVLDMSNGGHIELNGTIYCWGFIKGQDMDQGNNTTEVGTITANNGSVIWEDFAVGDWRGGTACSTIAGNASSWKFFPFQSYTIQNVEVPTTYHYGATLSNYTNVYGGGGKNEGTFSLIGKSNTLFQLKDASSSVCKWYDPTTDLVNYEMRGTAQLDALNVDAGITTVSSSSYNLPLSSNMQIVLAAGCNMTLSKPMVVQPGAVVEVKKGASLTLSSNTYIFDVDNWGMYCNGRYFYSMTILTSHKNRGTGKSKDLLDDAKLIVDGTLNVTGKIYATDGGANIMGNGAGSISLSSLGGNGNIVMCTGVSTNENVAIAQANLCNEDESYTKAIASTTFYNVHGRWFKSGNQNENADHTYNFTYIASGAVSGTGGTDVSPNTHNALYAPDKTGLAAGMKWCNVAQDATCSNIYNATQALNETPASDIRYTYPSSSWLQLLRTETEGVYGGSDNSLYAVEGCAVNSLGSVDENCLYTINDVKKALVDGHFVALEKNTEDEAWHDVANPTNYYISFAGCTWHPATKYAGEEKAYIVEEGDYIWYNNDWLLVEREDPFFFDYNEQNVKRYYEYEDGAWVLAEPRVRVVDAIETRDFYFWPEAFAIANSKKNATITLLKNVSSATSPLSFTAKNTTCTLDLNGHTASLTITASGNSANLFAINAANSTFTITDNSANKDGVLDITTSLKVSSTSYHTRGIAVVDGALILNAGTVRLSNTYPYTSTSNSGMIKGINVAAGKSFTMNGGAVYAESPYYPRAINVEGSTSANAIVNINNGTITAHSTTTTNAMGIYTIGGTLNVKPGVTINATTTTTSAYGIYVDASTNGYFGTLNMTGGTVNATGATGTAYGIFVSGVYVSNNTTPNTFGANYKAKATISGGTFNVTTTSKTVAYGVCSRGTTTISGGDFTVAPATTTAIGVFAQDGTTTIEGNPTFDVSATEIAYGIQAGNQPVEKTGQPFNGNVIVKGGTFDVQTRSKTTAYGVYVYAGTRNTTSTSSGYYPGHYVSAGKATIEGGTFNVTSKTTTAYGVHVIRATPLYDGEGNIDAYAQGEAIIKGGRFTVVGTTTASKTPTTDAIRAYGDVTITGGEFEVTAPGGYVAGLRIYDGKTTISGNPTFTVRGSTYAYGAFVTGVAPTSLGFISNAELEINNGSFDVATTGTTYAYGVLVSPVAPVATEDPEVFYKSPSTLTINDGHFTVKAQTTTAQGVNCSRGYLMAGTLPNTLLAENLGTAHINGGTFDVSTLGTTTAQGITNSGNTTVGNATFNVTPKTTTAYGARCYHGLLTINEGSEFNVTATATAYGVVAGNEQPTTGGVLYDAEVVINGGTIDVKTTSKATIYGLWASRNSRTIATGTANEGNYASAGKITVNGGEIKVAAKTNPAYAVLVDAVVTQSGNADYPAATATPQAFINGGKFYVTATSSKNYAVSATPLAENCQITGGYYNVNRTQTSGTTLAKYAVSPKKVLTLRESHSLYPDGYRYSVNEGGTVTWKNGTTTLKTEVYESGETPVYTGETPTKTADAQYTYTHNGWSPDIAAMENSDVTYTATFSKAEIKYTVSVAAGANGAVSPASVSNVGCETASDNITATPNVGYSFSGWTLPTGVTAADGYTVASNPIHIHATATGKSITANFTANTGTAYTVEHYWQNIDNNDYTKHETEGKTGTTDAATAAVAKSYTGFTAKPFAQGTIAGNGSTVVKIYYDRITYAITWVDGNGATIKTDDVKYGATPAYTGETPTKNQTVEHTYTFNENWSPAITPVTGEATYTAQFDEAGRKYSITWRGEGITERTDQVEYGTTPEYGILPTKDPTVQQVFTYKWMNVDNAEIGVKPVTGDATYEGSFTGSPRPYTITFVNDDNTTLQSSEVGYGSTPSYGGSTPESSHTGDANRTYTFIGWSPEITVVGEAMTYTAVYNCAVDPIVVVADETKTVAINTTTTTTTVEVKGKLNVAADKTLTTDDLILEGTPSSSGEITGEGTVAATRALFHFSQPGGFKERTWYAVAVPWQVDVPAYQLGGVYIKKGEGEYVQQTLGSTFDLIYYNGELRATGASKAWNYVENDPAADRIMVPGRAYMIYLVSDADTIRFERKADAPLHTNSLKTKKYAVSEGVNSDYADWNGIANPATYHAYINVGATDNKGQVYNPDTKQYEMFNMSSNKLVVGQPIFVQPQTAKTVVASDTYGTYSPAPRRAKAEESMTRYELYLAPSMDVATDRIIVRMSEDKETDEYIVGQDLAKMGVSSLVPQMWVDRYDSKMCINTAIPTDDQAYYPLGISVPQNGEYDIFLDDEPDSESTLYLTYDGEVIWNLSYGFYVAHLEKGTNTHYGLRIVKTPKVATGIDNAETSGKDINVYKIIVDDKVFIIRGNQVYGIDGRLAK